MNNDTVYRQAAIDALADYIHNVDKVYSTGKLSAYDCKDAAWSVLGELPSAQPDRSLWFRIGEICVDESKGFISSDRAVEKIRELLKEERMEE